MVRVQRQVGPACLEHRQHRFHQQERGLEAYPDNHLRPHARGHQQPCQPARAGIQLAVTEALCPACERRGPGRRCRLRRKQVDQRTGKRRRRRHHRTGTGKGTQQAPSLLGAQDVQANHRQVRLGHRTLEEPHQPGGVRLEPGQVVERRIAVEVDPDVASVAAIVDSHVHVLDRGPVRQVASLGRIADEARPVGEALDVDARAQSLGFVRPQTERAAQILVPEAPMRLALAHLLPASPKQVAHRRERCHPEPQRHDVGPHAGDPPRRCP